MFFAHDEWNNGSDTATQNQLNHCCRCVAQLPAQTPSQYNQLMEDLVSTGEEGFMNLVGRLNPPGNKSNEVVDYAISGWIHFVANNDAQRAIAASACEKVLQQPLDDEIKAMLIRQLELIGDDSNVAVLSTLLTNERLLGPASQALAHIGTPAAVRSSFRTFGIRLIR